MAILTEQNTLYHGLFQYTSVVIWFVHANDDGLVLGDVLNYVWANVTDKISFLIMDAITRSEGWKFFTTL